MRKQPPPYAPNWSGDSPALATDGKGYITIDPFKLVEA